jgi:hypothetical protein
VYTAGDTYGVVRIVINSPHGGNALRRTCTGIVIAIWAVTAFSLGLPDEPQPLAPRPGTGIFLMLSDLHFDPYADPAILAQLGAKALAPCQAPAAPGFSKYGSDTNYPLLKSALDNVAATAAQNHFRYRYVIITGDFLAHDFDTRYHECVGGDATAYRKFASDTIRFVDRMIAAALPGVPVFAALGNNDSDNGDYAEPSAAFLQSVGTDWSRAWNRVPAGPRARALATLARAGNYSVPNPAVPRDELVVLNSNLWAAHNKPACSEADPDPEGQFQWLEGVLASAERAGRSATLVMHILPGVDAMKSSLGAPRSLWAEPCTRKLIAALSAHRGVVRELYAGHIHRDDFRLLPGSDGAPLCLIHIVPAISPVYLNNPAVEIGWYDVTSGDLADFATLDLDLGSAKPVWATEYVFTRAYGRPRPDLAAMEELSRAIHAGDPGTGVGKHYADYYGAGVRLLLTPQNWLNFACAQTEITLSGFAQCKQAPTGP